MWRDKEEAEVHWLLVEILESIFPSIGCSTVNLKMITNLLKAQFPENYFCEMFCLRNDITNEIMLVFILMHRSALNFCVCHCIKSICYWEKKNSDHTFDVKKHHMCICNRHKNLFFFVHESQARLYFLRKKLHHTRWVITKLFFVDIF